MNDDTNHRALSEIFYVIIGLLGIVFFLANPLQSAGGIMQGLELCYKSVIPSLFPFFVFSKLVMGSKFAHILGLLLYPYTRFVLRIKDKSASTALLLGFIGGFGCGGACLQSLHENNKLTSTQTKVLLTLIVNAGPAFTVACVGTSMLGSVFVGWLMFTSLTVAGLITGAVFTLLFSVLEGGGKAQKNLRTICNVVKTKKTENNRNEEKGNLFVISVKSAVYSTLTLCGFVVIFSFLISCLNTLYLPKNAQIIVSIFTEVTLANSLIAQNSGTYTVYLCCAALSIMGASIVLQICSLINNNISIFPLIYSRIIHTPVSILVLYLLLKSYNIAVPVVLNSTIYTTSMPFDAICAVTFFICAFFVSLKKC